jgi:ribonucleoside-diphosphate reductase alpha chain
MKGKNLLEMSRDRGYFIDQSQSFNMFMEDASVSKLTSAHFYGWKLGLKTGMYYLRTKPKAQALKGLGIDTSSLDKPKVEAPVEETPQCKIDDPDCLACGS